MKKKPTQFKVGQHVRVKSDSAAVTLLRRVWLTSDNAGLKVRILALDHDSFGFPKVLCHKVIPVGRRGKFDHFWVPPAALEKS